MKLLIISQHFWPENFIINNLSEELVRQKINVSVITGKPNYLTGKIKKKFKPFSITKTNFKGAEVYRLPIISRGKKSAIRLVLNYISFIISGVFLSLSKIKHKQIDFIFVYATSPLLQALIGVYLKFRLKKKLIIWVQDLWPEVLTDTKYIQNKIILKIINVIVKFIFNRADLVLAQSNSFKIHLKKNYKIKNILTFENPGINTKGKIKNKISKKKTILYTGNIGRAQPFDKIIKIVKKLKKNNKIIFKIIGSGSKYDWLKDQIKFQNLEKKIILEKFKNQKLLKKDYDNSDFLLILLSKGLSLSKTIPNKFQNYLSIGKPIICIGSGEIERKIVKNNLGIVFKENKNDIQHFFKNLSDFTKNNFTKYYKNNIEYFKKNYKLYKKTKILYKIIKKIA